MKSLSFLALGDSYTIGEGVPKNESYPVQLAKALKSNGVSESEVEIIATTGWTTSDLLNAIKTKPPLKNHYSYVFLLIGVNNQYQEKPISLYDKEFAELVDVSLKYSSNNPDKVFVLSIPDYSYTPYVSHEKKTFVSQNIEEYNQINKSVAMAKGVNYVDITELTKYKDPKGFVVDDQLHPSGKAYKLWVDKIYPILSEKIKKASY